MVVPQHERKATAGDPLAILGNYRRRAILAIVSKAGGAVPRELLAKRVAAAQYDKPVDAVTEPEVEQSAIHLHHVDLPRLNAAGLVNYDVETGLVESGELPLEGDEWLDMPVVEALEAWNGPR